MAPTSRAHDQHLTIILLRRRALTIANFGQAQVKHAASSAAHWQAFHGLSSSVFVSKPDAGSRVSRVR